MSRPAMISNRHPLDCRLLRLFLFAVGLSIGTLSILCLRSFAVAPIPSFSFYVSILASTSDSSLLFLPNPSPPSSSSSVSPEPILRTPPPLGLIMHNMSDEELLARAASSVGGNASSYKVAFMFLTPGPLPLAPVWDRFFKGHNGLFSVYVHPRPSYNDSSVPPDSAFYGRRIPSKPVYWGTTSMIDAERRLLANALLDSSNQRFILLSESCIPLFNFTTIYNYLKATNLSFVGTYYKPDSRRYNGRMWPNITTKEWRKGSQWFEANRNLAVKIVSDQTYYPLFNKFCRSPCYSDEHYLQTLVHIRYPESSYNRSITWVDWSRGGAHPRKYRRSDVKPGLMNRVRFGSECLYNGNTTNICYLFARKFMPSTVGSLLEVATSLLGFDS